MHWNTGEAPGGIKYIHFLVSFKFVVININSVSEIQGIIKTLTFDLHIIGHYPFLKMSVNRSLIQTF